MAAMYYVTAFAMPAGATQIPLHRTDMAKFFTREDADGHVAALKSPNFYDILVEEREDPEAG